MRRLAGLGFWVCLLLAVIWAGSVKCILAWQSHNWVAGVRNGAFCVNWSPGSGWNLESKWIFNFARGFRVLWLPAYMPDSALGGLAVLPLWIPLILMAGLTFFCWRRGRPRRGTGLCLKCGYDLTGNVSGRCPECGQSTSSAAERDQ